MSHHFDSSTYFTMEKVYNNDEHIFDETTMNIIYNLTMCITKAMNNESKIEPDTYKGHKVLTLKGMTGVKTRHLYNNILGCLQNVKYLEIGTWNGSSSLSALYKNHNIVKALFIDNWSQFGGSNQVFSNTLTKFKDDITPHHYLLESDCWKVDLSTIGAFNVYLYDGGHTELDHYKALEYYLPALEDTFVFLIDDWNWCDVRDGTMRAIKELNLDIQFRHEIFVSPEDFDGMPHINRSNQTWWNGCGIFLLSKIHKPRLTKTK